MKNLLMVAAAAAGALALAKKAHDQQAERELWAEATDDLPAADAASNHN